MPFPNPATQFKPGQSGNAPGYSRARRFTDRLLKLIEDRDADGKIAEMWLAAILAGDFRYFKEFIDRTEGRSPSPPDGEPPDDMARDADGNPLEP